MIVCPVCGFRNMDANDRCFKCSALLRRDEEVFREASRTSARASRRDRIHRLFTAPVDWLRHHPVVRRIFALPDNPPYRYPFTAGLLNLVPGLGYLYVGQPLRAALTALIVGGLVVAAVLTIKHPYSNWLLFTLLGLAFLLWADGVATAAKSNGDYWRLRKTVALACAAMMILGSSVTILQWFGMDILTLQRISQSSLAPSIRSGDRVAVSDIPLWFRAPRVGEVVMYNPPRFVAEQGPNIISINISKYLQRVIAGPGDTVAKKGDVFYRNGQPLSPQETPFRGELLPDFQATIPADSYFIPVTGVPSDAFGSLSGAPPISHVGEQGYIFLKYPDFYIIPEEDISSLALGIVNPPPRRHWGW